MSQFLIMGLITRNWFCFFGETCLIQSLVPKYVLFYLTPDFAGCQTSRPCPSLLPELDLIIHPFQGTLIQALIALSSFHSCAFIPMLSIQHVLPLCALRLMDNAEENHITMLNWFYYKFMSSESLLGFSAASSSFNYL